MISDREEAHATGAFNAPKNIKNGSVVKKLSPKNLGVSNEFWDTVYLVKNVWSLLWVNFQEDRKSWVNFSDSINQILTFLLG